MILSNGVCLTKKNEFEIIITSFFIYSKGHLCIRGDFFIERKWLSVLHLDFINNKHIISLQKKQKKTMRKLTTALKTQKFWTEYISIYTSIFMVTIFIHVGILHSDTLLLLICLIESIVTTIPNVIVVMYGRTTQIVKRHWFVETLLYTISSIPIIQIIIFYQYTDYNLWLTIDMLKWCIIAYFVMGLFIKSYLRFANMVITKIFERELFWFSLFLYKYIARASPCKLANIKYT